VGVEDELVLMDPRGWSPANCADELVGALPAHASTETHACVVELKTGPHETVAEMAEELGALRRWSSRFAGEELGLRLAGSGTHPLATHSDVQLSSGPRYRDIERMTRAVAHREPTMALHVHVAVPDGELAVRALDGLRCELPLLLALSANSPFWRARDSGFASMRTPLLSMFPRFGIPRRFGSYARYIEVVGALLRSRAVPEPGFLWWDVRLQPRLGTVEVRIMDAQTRVSDVAALAALVQCLVFVHACADQPPSLPQELLDENRFLAARDGLRARLASTPEGRTRLAGDWAAELIDSCLPVAETLGCISELAHGHAMAGNPAEARQRRLAASAGLAALPALLSAELAPAERPVLAA
jgi:carboxylate-amine ligase